MGMFAVTSLESVCINFPDSLDTLERLFGPDGEVSPNWFEITLESLSTLIEDIRDSTDESKRFLHQQCLIARAIITFAKSSSGELHMLCYDCVKELLEFQFAFEEARHAFLFRSDVRDYVQASTGLQL